MILNTLVLLVSVSVSQDLVGLGIGLGLTVLCSRWHLCSAVVSMWIICVFRQKW